MNAIELLETDHRKVEELFAKAKSAEGRDKQLLFEQIRTELEVHAHLEETIFYPQVEAAGDEELKSLVQEAYTEHGDVKTLLSEIASLDPNSEAFDNRLTELMENVEHHVAEEEGEMFEMVEDQFEEEVLETLATTMLDEKSTTLKSMGRSA